MGIATFITNGEESADSAQRATRSQGPIQDVIIVDNGIMDKRYISSSVGQLSVRNFFVSCSQLSVRQLVDVRC